MSTKQPQVHSKESAPVKKRKRTTDTTATKTTGENNKGLDEIDALFSEKKHKKKQQQQDEKTNTATKKSRASKPSFSKADLDTMKQNQWVDDGLGGKFNREGYTGRREDGVKVYKAHLLNRPNFGTTDQCPFDCDCCFI